MSRQSLTESAAPVAPSTPAKGKQPRKMPRGLPSDDEASDGEEQPELDEHGNTIGEDYDLNSSRALKKFRMYESEFPEIDELVMVQVRSIADMGAYVSLLEYNNIEGMILLSELTRRRIRSVSKLIKVGRVEPVMVLRVDKEKAGFHSSSHSLTRA